MLILVIIILLSHLHNVYFITAETVNTNLLLIYQEL